MPSYRTPSYSARVLVHSLPQHASRLTVTGYDMCDNMRGSKHLPVSATMDLLVDRSIHGFQTLPAPQRPVPWSLASHLDSKQDETHGEPETHVPSPVSPLVVELELRNLTFDLHEPRCSVGQVALLYPVPTEDPFAPLRSHSPHPSTGELRALLQSTTRVSLQQDRGKAHVRLFRATTLVHPTFR
jgi:hypothetical protein